MAHFVRHGLSNGQIARRFGISLDAVKFHISNIVEKLQLDSRAALRCWSGIPADSALRRKTQMGTSLKLESIGQISRSVRSIEKSVEWYGKVLGLPHLFTFGKLSFFDCGGTRLFLEETEDSHPESILYLRVPDIHGAYNEMRERGIEFTNAPHMIHRHDDGTEEWMAFFKDLEGRPLAIMCQTRPER